MSSSPLSRGTSRLLRFVRSVRECRRHRIRLDRRNIRALWTQSDPNYNPFAGIDLTDEEYERFMEAING